MQVNYYNPNNSQAPPATRQPTPPTDPAKRAEYDAARGQSGQRYTPPPPPPPQPSVGGQRPWMPYSPPGYAEKYWEDNAYKFDQPTQASQYWNGQQGWFTNPQQGETDAYGYAGDLGGTTGAMENLYDQYNKAGEFTSPWASEDYYKNNQGFFGNEGSMEQFWGQHANDLNGPGSLESHMGNLEQDIGSARGTQDFWNANRGYLSGPGYTENLANHYRPEASYSEQFLTGGGAGEGLDSLYDRLYQQGSRRLGDEGAARGGFNSGASLRATEELGRDLTSQHVRDVQSAANQADTQKMSRLGYGLNLMTGADTSMRGRISTGIESAHVADQSGLERASAGQKLYEGVGEEKRQNLRTSGGLANDAQSAALARILGGSTAASASDVARHNRLTAGTEAADRSQRSWQDRLKSASDISLSAQDRALARILGGNAVATGVDTGNLARLTGGMNAAIGAETSRQNRQNGVFDNLFRLGSGQAGTYGGGMDRARQEEFQTAMEDINGRLQRGEITATEYTQRMKQMLQMLGMPMAAAGGGGAGGGAARRPSSGGAQPYDPEGVLPYGG